MADEPDAPLLVARALREAIPTRRHADMLFGMMLDHLGDSAWVETLEGGTTRTLFRRLEPGSDWIIPWPLLRVSYGGREGPGPIPTEVPGVYEEPAPRPGRAPRLRELGAGHVELHDGPHAFTVTYGGDGRWFETTAGRTAGEFGKVVSVLESGSGAPTELIATLLSNIDLERHGPARVRLPVALPHGAKGVWRCALHAMREALFRQRIPIGARWVCADGWTGGALASGLTRDEAVSSWRAELARVRPFPAKPEPLPDTPDEPEGMQSIVTETGFAFFGTIRGPSSDAPWMEPTVENSPCAVIELSDLPTTAAPIGDWIRLVDAYGNTVPAALRWEPEGLTLLGDRVGNIDLGRLERQIAEADANAYPWPEPSENAPFERPVHGSQIRVYRFVDESGERVTPKITADARRDGIKPAELDPEDLRGSVARMRPL